MDTNGANRLSHFGKYMQITNRNQHLTWFLCSSLPHVPWKALLPVTLDLLSTRSVFLQMSAKYALCVCALARFPAVSKTPWGPRGQLDNQWPSKQRCFDPSSLERCKLSALHLPTLLQWLFRWDSGMWTTRGFHSLVDDFSHPRLDLESRLDPWSLCCKTLTIFIGQRPVASWVSDPLRKPLFSGAPEPPAAGAQVKMKIVQPGLKIWNLRAWSFMPEATAKCYACANARKPYRTTRS